MSYHSKTDLLKMGAKMGDDIRALQARLGELMEAVSGLPIADIERPRCPHCGPINGGPRALAEHMHVSHGVEEAVAA